jgi:hypothetical protein
MKKKILFVLVSLLFFISCDKNFSPYGEFKDKYIFTSIIRSDSTLQVATLFHNYKPDGYDPYTYTEDSQVKGADIRVLYDDSVFVFRDSSVARIDTSRYHFPFSFYYNNKFKVAPKKPIEVEVLLQNGKRLRAASVIPADIRFQDKSAVIVPPVGSNFIQFFWDDQGEGIYFKPYLAVRYKVNENGNIVEKEKEIPLRFVEQNGEFKPIYPTALNLAIVSYQQDAVDRILQEISADDPNKSNYSIYQKIKFTVAAYDLPLSRYVSSTGKSLDDLTVTIDVADYSNIDGGLGIFGTFVKKNYDKIKFYDQYINSFGYNFIFEN